MTEPMLQVDGLQVRRGKRTVLSVDSLAVAPGEILAVIGANGAGKSTLLQAMALLLPATMTYRFAGRVAELPRETLALRRQMAVVFQEPLLLDGTVAENVALGLKLRGVPAAAIRERVSHWLEQLGVAHLVSRHARSLSGGEAQRVSLARALALEPRVLFLDEPFGALDVLTRVALVQELRALLKKAEVTALFITHDFAEVPLLADRVAVVHGGQLAQVGSPQEIFRQPATDEVRALVRAAADLVRALGSDQP